MNCPHVQQKADLHLAMCPKCVEVAESYSKALKQSLSLHGDKHHADTVLSASVETEKRHPERTA